MKSAIFGLVLVALALHAEALRTPRQLVSCLDLCKSNQGTRNETNVLDFLSCAHGCKIGNIFTSDGCSQLCQKVHESKGLGPNVEICLESCKAIAPAQDTPQNIKANVGRIQVE
eukprot:Colp12_sorted_trinity150504_noHs@15420